MSGWMGSCLRRQLADSNQHLAPIHKSLRFVSGKLHFK
jgi:hypothetical protein